MKLLLAYIHQWWFCLLRMHKGVCCYSEITRGRVIKLAACTGSFDQGTLQIVKTFYAVQSQNRHKNGGEK
jgi:hypothetical protein